MIKVGDCVLCQKADSELYNVVVKVTAINGDMAVVESARGQEDFVKLEDLKPSKFNW